MANTDWVVGMVLYTGTESKLMLNQGKNRFKQSQMEKVINYIMLYDLVFFVIFILLFGGLDISFMWTNRAVWYLGIDKEWNNYGFDFTLRGIEGVFTWWLLLNQLIPLTLVIILELTKIWYTNVI
jgi:magnesium-transporting ATPase (P-type)